MPDNPTTIPVLLSLTLASVQLIIIVTHFSLDLTATLFTALLYLTSGITILLKAMSNNRRFAYE